MNATATIEKPSVSDEVLREVWRIKDELSESYGHDIEKLFADIQKNNAFQDEESSIYKR